MASLQRRRGIEIKFHKVTEVTDKRGNRTKMATGETVTVRGAVVPDRSSRAEVPGQMEINVLRIITDSDLPDVSIWSRVEMMGTWWDPVTPPEMHRGTTLTRHWSFLVRRRTDGGGHLKAGASNG